LALELLALTKMMMEQLCQALHKALELKNLQSPPELTQQMPHQPDLEDQ